jgi:hypothetical protein
MDILCSLYILLKGRGVQCDLYELKAKCMTSLSKRNSGERNSEVKEGSYELGGQGFYTPHT